jgi:hypothetical protein
MNYALEWLECLNLFKIPSLAYEILDLRCTHICISIKLAVPRISNDSSKIFKPESIV